MAEEKEETITLKKKDWQAAMDILDKMIALNEQQDADMKAYMSRLRRGDVVEGAIIAEQKQIEEGK